MTKVQFPAWINVHTQLPEVKEKVLTCEGRGVMRVNFLQNDYGPTEWNCCNDWIKYWMPLPSPAR